MNIPEYVWIGSWICIRQYIAWGLHCVKSVRIRSYSGQHLSRIFQHSDVEKCAKNADQNNSEYGLFLRSALYKLMSTYWEILIERYLFKDLWWSPLEKYLQFLTMFVKRCILNPWGNCKYVSGFKYVKILNIRKFPWIWQDSKYAWGWNYGRVVNIPGFQGCQISAYVSFPQSSIYAWIWLNNALCRVLNIPDQRFKGF